MMNQPPDIKMKLLVHDYEPGTPPINWGGHGSGIRYRLMELSELEVEVIEKIKPKDITVASYVEQFLANESQDPQDLHDFLDKELNTYGERSRALETNKKELS